MLVFRGVSIIPLTLDTTWGLILDHTCWVESGGRYQGSSKRATSSAGGDSLWVIMLEWKITSKIRLTIYFEVKSCENRVGVQNYCLESIESYNNVTVF